MNTDRILDAAGTARDFVVLGVCWIAYVASGWWIVEGALWALRFTPGAGKRR